VQSLLLAQRRRHPLWDSPGSVQTVYKCCKLRWGHRNVYLRYTCWEYGTAHVSLSPRLNLANVHPWRSCLLEAKLHIVYKKVTKCQWVGGSLWFGLGLKVCMDENVWLALRQGQLVLKILLWSYCPDFGLFLIFVIAAWHVLERCMIVIEILRVRI
jgi:hypothetical protein